MREVQTEYSDGKNIVVMKLSMDDLKVILRGGVPATSVDGKNPIMVDELPLPPITSGSKFSLAARLNSLNG